MPKFLNADELYNLYQRELPDGVYQMGQPSASYSGSSLYAKASALADVYSNLSVIYTSYFPQTADEKITDWEKFVFGKVSATSLLLDKQNAVVTKLRYQPDLSEWTLLTQILGIVPSGVYVQLAGWGAFYSGGAGWVIGVSKLGLDTCFAHGNGFNYTGNNYINTVGPSAPTALTQSQDAAYTIEVRIFASVGSAVIDQILLLLTQIAPARCRFLVFDNLSLSTYNLTLTVNNVDRYSLVNTAKVDPTSTTNYTGKRAA